MTASTVDISPVEQVARWSERVGILEAEDAALAARLAEIEADERADVLAELPRDRAREAEARGLREDRAYLAERIATLTSERDALAAQVKAQEQAARVARERAAAQAALDQTSAAAADWQQRAVAAFLGPVLEMDPTTLLAVAAEAGVLLQRLSTATMRLANVLAQPHPRPEALAEGLLEPVTSRLPVQPPRRQLFAIARTGSRANVLRKIADLLDIPGA